MNMYIHLREMNVKQEKLCEAEDMTFEDEWDKDGNRIKFLPGNKELEELGVENAIMDEDLRRAIEHAKRREQPEWEPGMPIPDIFKDKNNGLKPANAYQIGGEHYKTMDIQPWDIVDNGPREQAIGFYRYNALKYVMRAGEKGEFQEDIAKAQHYLQKLLEILE